MKNVLLLTTIALMACDAGAAEEWRFDFGAADSPVAAGWTQFTPADACAPERGFGWTVAPELAFSRDRYWNGELPLWHAPMRELPLDPLTRDGVASTKPMELRLDVPRGRYVVRVWVGDYLEAARAQCVEANGRPLAAPVTAGIGGLWGQILRAVIVPVRGIVAADDGRIVLKFYTKQPKHAAKVVAVQVRPYEPGWVKMEGTKLRWTGPPSREAETICELINAGKADEARKRIARIQGRPFEKACLLEALSGSLAISDPRQCESIVEEALKLLSEAHDVSSHALAERQQLLEDWRTALTHYRMMRYAWAYKQTKKDSYRRYEEAAALANTIQPNEPAYWQAQLLRARLYVWRGIEGSPPSTEQAKPIVADLYKHFPEHRLVRLYAGQPVPSLRPQLPKPPADAPEWAVRQRELLKSVLDVARFWIAERQTPEGELGGGWNDDVEVLRRWGAVALALDVPWLNAAIAKMADGVWNNNPDLQKYGYPADLGDVEHNAEDVSDTQPLALALNYGEPRFVERCLLAVSRLGSHWTAMSPRGFRRFKSYNYGAERIDPDPKAAYDVPLNGRAAKPGLWALWYSGHPEIMRLFGEWGLGWVEATARTDGGKPAGVIPAGVRVADDSFPPKWYATPGYSAIGTARYSELLYEHLLAMWLFSGNEEFLETMHGTIRFVIEQHRAGGDGPAGSPAWVAKQLWPQVREVISKWRLISGDTRYDELLRADAMPYVKQLLGGDERLLLDNLKQTAEGNSQRFEMLTSEVLYTDRIFIRGHEHLYAMYGGGIGDTSGCPGWAVRWEMAGEDLAAWVVEATTAKFRARVFNFARGEKKFAMQHWRLAPGRYKLTLRLDASDAKPLEEREVELSHRGDSIPLRLPARRALVVELALVSKLPWEPTKLPDLTAAAAPSSANAGIAWEVFNLGCVAASDVAVELRSNGTPVGRCTLEEVPATAGYCMGHATARFQHQPASKAKLTLVLDPAGRIPEITERNNTIHAADLRSQP